MKLIDKAALVAEIEKLINRYKTCQTHNSYEDGLKEGRLIGYEDALYKINTLEVKEVDLEKEWKECFKYRGDVATVNLKHLAKHFFELGINARKEE